MSKYKQVKVNLSLEDFEKVSNLASQKKITKAEFIRQNLKLKYKNVPTPKLSKNDKIIFYELRKIGNNLNQIAKYANEKKILDREILASLINIKKDLNNLL